MPGLPGKGGWVRRACVPGGCPGMGCSCGWNANNFPCRSYGWWGSTLLGPEGISTCCGGSSLWLKVVVGHRPTERLASMVPG